MKHVAILACLLALGCTSETEKKCEKYAELEVRCGDFPKDQRDMTKKLAQGFCEEALGGNDMLNLKPEVACAQKHSSCAEYLVCQEAAGGI